MAEPAQIGFGALRALARRTLAASLYGSGLLHLLFRLRLRRRCVVLMYHRVLDRVEMDETCSHPGIIVERATFGRQLEFLRRHFHVASLAEFEEGLSKGFARPTCLITFDDGWVDNYANAFPLLREHGLPAVIFLPTGFVGTGRRFWQESLAHSLIGLLRSARGRPSEDLRRILDALGIAGAAEMSDEDARLQVRLHVSRAKELPEAERRSLIDRATTLSGSEGGAAVDRFLDWEQVRRMAAEGIAFGSHSVDHELLTEVSEERVRDEIASSKAEIEHVLGTSAAAFSYPSGRNDEYLRTLVAEAGYRIAFGIRPGTAGPGDDPYAIRRVNIHEGGASTIPLFMAELTGLL